MKWFHRKNKPKPLSLIKTLEGIIDGEIDACILGNSFKHIDELEDRMSNATFHYYYELMYILSTKLIEDQNKLTKELIDLYKREEEAFQEWKRKKPLAGVK